MKALLSRTWVRYLIVFVVALMLVGGWFRFGPNPDPEGSNLLVNSVLAAILTAIYVCIEKFFKRISKKKE